jgi:hypothetical protein
MSEHNPTIVPGLTGTAVELVFPEAIQYALADHVEDAQIVVGFALHADSIDGGSP